MVKISNNGEREGVGAIHGGNKDAVMVGVPVGRVCLLQQKTTLYGGLIRIWSKTKIMAEYLTLSTYFCAYKMSPPIPVFFHGGVNFIEQIEGMVCVVQFF